MSPWMLALLFKPLVALAIVGAYYLVIIRGLRWLYPKLPQNRLTNFLFRERGKRHPDYGPGYSIANGNGDRGTADSAADLRKLPNR